MEPRPRAAGWWRGGAALTLALALPFAGTAQEYDDTVSYRNGANVVLIGLHLDSLGVYPAPGVEEDTLAEYLAEWELHLEGRMPAGTWVAAFGGQNGLPEDLFALGRQLYLDRPDLVENAGPLGRFVDSGAALVLTDQFIVLYREGVAEGRIDSLVSAWDAEELLRAPTEPELRLYRTTPASPGGVMDLIAGFESSSLTRWAYPDFLEGAHDAGGGPPRGGSSPGPTPPDPLQGHQWHLSNSSGADISVNGAWSVTRGSPSVVIAITETGGFRADHPDLQSRLWQNQAEVTGTGGVDDDGNGYVDDIHGWDFRPCINNNVSGCGSQSLLSFTQTHGTAVAGMAAADGDNGIGVSGVCPDCRLMLLPMGGGQIGKELAFRYARDNGASVINASWIMDRKTPLEDVIRQVATGSGTFPAIPVVFAMGKGPDNVCEDVGGATRNFVSMSEVLAVGASDDQDARVSSTNWGPCIDLMAPGGWSGADLGITTTDVQGAGGYNPAGASGCPRSELASTQDYTNCFGGSSASAAIVSGLIGLMRSVNPVLSPDEIRTILVETAVKIDCASAEYGGPGNTACPSDPWQLSQTHGYGRVDAAAAVAAAGKAFEDLKTKVAAAGSGSGDLELGFRLGWTRLSGSGPAEDVWNVPGSGPGSEPVLHLTWLGTSPFLFETQVGWWHSSRGTVDQSNRVAALQAALSFSLGSMDVYAGPNFAVQHIDDGVSPLNDTAWGVALGYRHLARPYMALRVEGRYRKWSTRSLDEWGVAVAVGVLF